MKRTMMQRLVNWKEDVKRKPLILRGVRQVGKTYLLKEFGRKHFRKFHYLNLEKQPNLFSIFEEDLVPERILRDLSFHFNESIEVGKDLLIFDEVQEAPKVLTSLKYFQEDCPNLHVCAAGSLLGLHLNSGSFPVGKVTFETLYPMTFEEFLWAGLDSASNFLHPREIQEKGIPKIVHDHLSTLLKHYLITGGLPEVIATYYENKENLFEAFKLVRKRQDDLLNSYYADIAKHSGKVNAMHIDRVFRSIASQISQIKDGSITRFKFRGVIPGISHYDRLAGAIDWLEATGLAIKIPIVHSAQLPLIGYTKESFFKLLLFDIGILGLMSDIPVQAILDADYGSYKGYIAENFAVQALLAYGNKNLFSWKEQQAEVDYLIESKAKIIPVEVKSGRQVKAKSLKIFSEKYKISHQYIFSELPLKIASDQKTHFYPLYLAGIFPLTMG